MNIFCEHQYINYTDRLNPYMKAVVPIYNGKVCEISEGKIINPDTGETLVVMKQEIKPQHEEQKEIVYNNTMHLIEKLCTTELYNGEDLWHLTCCKFEEVPYINKKYPDVVRAKMAYPLEDFGPSGSNLVTIEHVIINLSFCDYDEINKIIDALYKAWDTNRIRHGKKYFAE